MNAQILGAILSWPTAVIVGAIVVLVLALVFRKPLKAFLNRLIELRAARTKEGMEFAMKGAEEPLTARETEEEEKAPKETKEAAKERKAREVVDHYVQAFEALWKKDFETYEKIYEQMIGEASSDEERAELESGKLGDYWFLHKKDVKADLYKLAERYPNSHHPLETLGGIYEDLEKYEKAEGLYQQAIEVCDDLEERLGLELRLCKAMRLQSRFEAAEERLTEMLTRYKADRQLSDIYQEWGKLLLAQNNMDRAQDRFEEALDYEPNKNRLRFQTAYRYGEMDKEENALHHYKILSQLTPDDSAMWNNLGVAYSRLGMPIKATKCYKKAAELGNSLAMANMARALIAKGFIEEAREWIDKGLECKKIDGAVGEALSSIDEKVEWEEEKKKEILDSLRKGVQPEEPIPF